MSLILPTTPVTPRPAPDPTTRTDGNDPADGAPFRQELIHAIGSTKAATTTPSGSTSSPSPSAGAGERLDPLGAALRALLGGESSAAASDGIELQSEQPAEGEETKESADTAAPADLTAATQSAPAAALVAELSSAISMDPQPAALAAPSVPPIGEGVQATSEPATGDPVSTTAVKVPVEPLQLVTDPLAEAQSVPMTVAESPVPEADAAPAPNSGSDRSHATKAAAAKGPTFENLVELISGAQAHDIARHTPNHPGSEAAPGTEPIAEPTAPLPSDEASEGKAEPNSPLAAKVDGPKPAFGQLLTTSTETEVRTARSTEIPAPALLNQVTRSIRLLAEGARSELHVKLHPAELGEVLVRLTIQDGVLNAQLQTTDAAVKATLDANLDALRARFEQHGMQVNSLAVSTGAGQLTDDGQAKSGWSQPANQNSGRNRDAADGDEPEESQEPTPARRILGRRWPSRLDHLA